MQSDEWWSVDPILYFAVALQLCSEAGSGQADTKQRDVRAAQAENFSQAARARKLHPWAQTV